MKYRRDVSSIPARSAEDTWRVIVNLVTGKDSVDPAQFEAAATVMASIIADQHMAEHPLTLKGAGMRVVVYAHYGADAMEAADEAPDRLPSNPTAGEWTLFVPCDPRDLPWVKKALSERAPRLVPHDLAERPDEALDKSEAGEGRAAAEITIDWGVFDRR